MATREGVSRGDSTWASWPLDVAEADGSGIAGATALPASLARIVLLAGLLPLPLLLLLALLTPLASLIPALGLPVLALALGVTLLLVSLGLPLLERAKLTDELRDLVLLLIDLGAELVVQLLELAGQRRGGPVARRPRPGIGSPDHSSRSHKRRRDGPRPGRCPGAASWRVTRPGTSPS